MKDVILNKVEEYREDIIQSILELVRIDSVRSEPLPEKPFGEGINKALEKALAISKQLGFETVNVDGYAGYAKYGDGDDYVGIFGHLDVVEPGECWKYPPFSGTIDENGCIVSRGVLDNKGPIISCLYALYILKELGIELHKPVRIVFGTNEESGFADMEYYLTKEKPPIMGWTPDCKYPVVYGERGRAVLQIKADKKCYGEFFNFLNTYFFLGKSNGETLGINYRDEVFGELVMDGYQMKEDEKQRRFEFNLKYPGSVTIEEIMVVIETKLTKGLSLCLLKNSKPVCFDKECDMVKQMQKAYEEVTGFDGTPVTTTGGTYAKVVPNIVPFGPSFPGQKGIGHNPNEWMNIEDIMMNVKIYTLALYYLAK